MGGGIWCELAERLTPPFRIWRSGIQALPVALFRETWNFTPLCLSIQPGV